MLNKHALAALAAYIAICSHVLADMAHKPPMAFCKEGTCSDDENGCPSQIVTSGDAFPMGCKVYTTETVLGDGDFEPAEGGGTKIFLDIFQPDKGCAVIVRSPASVGEIGCGFNVGTYHQPICVAVTLQDTFMIQHCCGLKNCDEAGAGAKMIRGMDYKRSLSGRSVEIRDKDGNVIQPKEEGYPPLRKPGTLTRRKANHENKNDDESKEDDESKDDDESRDDNESKDNDESCKKYVPDGEAYTTSANATQIVARGVNGGTGGAEVEITKERSVSQSITFSAGINIEIISASTEISFEETITNGKAMKWTVPAGQTGKVGFTPNLKCTKGKVECNGKTIEKGVACTGYMEADEIAGTYAVISTS
ncbi:MAG: hypothetical protein Q9221_002686 [Calogaya cf. arnoldii]